jgi:hypothetical protein
MKPKKSRHVEIFSLSALDLFAAAMGAFIIVTVLLFPYFNKGRALEHEIGELQPSVTASISAAVEAESRADRRASENEPVASASPTSDSSAESRALTEELGRKASLAAKEKELHDEISAAEIRLAEAEKLVQSTKIKVSFRVLGLKTHADNFLILVDGSRRVKDTATNLPIVIKNILSVLGPQTRYAIAFYDYDDRAEYFRWPQSGLKEGGDQTMNEALEFVRTRYGQMKGGSGTMQALRTALRETADSIILVSDGAIVPPHNENKDWTSVVRDVSLANTSKVEINAVAVGLFYRAPLWSFLNELRRANHGDIKALMP